MKLTNYLKLKKPEAEIDNVLIEDINENSDSVDKKLEEIDKKVEENGSAIGQIDEKKLDKGFGIGEQTVSRELDLNKYSAGGKSITPQTGLINLPDGWPQGRHTIDVTGGESYVTQILSADIGSSGQAPKVAVRFGKGLNLTPLWATWKEISWKETPTETIITSGFVTGWSGSLRYRKNQDGYVTIKGTLKKNIDIGTGVETIYTLPSGFRPIGLNERITVNGYNEFSVSIPNSFLNLAIAIDGRLMVYPVVNTNLVGVKQLYDFSFGYYA